VLWLLRAVPPAVLAFQGAMSRNAYIDGPLPEWWLPQLAANFAAPHTQRTFQEEAARIGDGDASIGPVAVGHPMLVIHGDDDRLAPVEFGHWTKAHARKAQIQVIEHGSHMLPITHTDQLADAIARFARGE
jgi:pimeloyl-ACP methyl ester carboxylesterase